MSLNDLMSDFVARIKNAKLADNNKTRVLKNNLVESVCKKLTTLGYLNGYEVEEFELIVDVNIDRINDIKRISKPGRRVYASHDDFPKIIGGIGFNIITTSKGVLTHIEASKQNLGGEVLFQIY